jgi:uncharacterized membrane protein HdeD (DUF308 family)
MREFLATNWWVLVVRGVAAVIFGVLTFLWPALSLAVLVILWGAFALVDGVFALVAAFKRPGGTPFPWWIFITGIAGVLAGVFTFISPAITAYALLLLIAAFAIVRGVMEIAAAIRLRKEISNEWLLILAGALAVVFGVLVFLFPIAGALAVTLWIGAVSLAIGVLEIVLGFKLRRRAGPAPGEAARDAMQGRA